MVARCASILAVILQFATPSFGQDYVDPFSAAAGMSDRVCEPDFDIRFSRERLCVTGFPERLREHVYESAVTGRREIQWDARDVLMREDFLSETWPVGVTGIRISDGEIAPIPNELSGSSIPNMRETTVGWLRFHYPENLSFMAGSLSITCSPSSLSAVPEGYVESCIISASMDGLRITVYALAGFFWDGGPGWPLLLRDYDEDAWQGSLDHVQDFLDHAILFREPR